jgi:hypothetical protein
MDEILQHNEYHSVCAISYVLWFRFLEFGIGTLFRCDFQLCFALTALMFSCYCFLKCWVNCWEVIINCEAISKAMTGFLRLVMCVDFWMLSSCYVPFDF